MAPITFLRGVRGLAASVLFALHPTVMNAAPPAVEADFSYFAEFQVGVWCMPDKVDSVFPTPGTLSGLSVGFARPPQMEMETQLVPNKEGLAFGVIGRVRNGVAKGELRAVITHPPRIGEAPIVETSVAALLADGTYLAGHFFETPSNRDLGRWTIVLTDGRKEILRAAFSVLPAKRQPELSHLCDEVTLS